MVGGEDSKVGGGKRRDRYFTLIFCGMCGWCMVGVIVFTRELLLSIFNLKNTQDQFVLTENKNLYMYVGYYYSDFD